MVILTYHIALKKGFQTEEVMRRVASAAGLENLNEQRARILEYSVISAEGGPDAKRILEGLQEVKSVQQDSEKRVLNGSSKA
jgi:hypothetical protein